MASRDYFPRETGRQRVRYDIFYFNYCVGPFLKIGEIEESSRHLFCESVDDPDQRIEETFVDHAERTTATSVSMALRIFIW